MKASAVAVGGHQELYWTTMSMTGLLSYQCDGSLFYNSKFSLISENSLVAQFGMKFWPYLGLFVQGQMSQQTVHKKCNFNFKKLIF